MTDVIKYPYDPTGVASTNLVEGEIRTIPRTNNRSFAPEYGPFYAESVSIITLPDNIALELGVHYDILYDYQQASKQTGLQVSGIIHVFNTDIVGQISLSYQTVGGDFSASVSAIQQMIEALNIDNRSIVFDDILDLPVQFPPSPHLHNINDTFGYEDVISALQDIRTAILSGDLESREELLNRLLDVENLATGYEAEITALQIAVAELQAALAGAALTKKETVIIGIDDTLSDEAVNELQATVVANIPLASEYSENSYIELFVAEQYMTQTSVLNCSGSDTVLYSPGNSDNSIRFSGAWSGRLLLISNGVDQWRLVVGYSSTAVYAAPPILGQGTWKVKLSNTVLFAGNFFVPDNAEGPCIYHIPAEPNDGDAVEWIASETLFSVNKMTFVTTDKSVEGDVEGLEVTQDGVCGRLVFRQALNTWKAYQTGVAGLS